MRRSRQVDVLALDDTVLLADAGSGDSLAGIDPAAHPAIKLRATLGTSQDWLSPDFDAWGLSWSTVQRLYLPVVSR
jgi:hypothetical protein